MNERVCPQLADGKSRELEVIHPYTVLDDFAVWELVGDVAD